LANQATADSNSERSCMSVGVFSYWERRLEILVVWDMLPRCSLVDEWQRLEGINFLGVQNGRWLWDVSEILTIQCGVLL